jgi:GDP-L-fucose synthase
VFSTSKECDLRDPAASLAYIKQVGPDVVVHLAALSGGISLSLNHPASVLRDNVLMAINILEAARLLPIKKTVMTLSAAMYPANAPIPLREASIYDGPAHPSNYSYAYAKRLIEPAIRAYRTEYAVNAIGLVPSGIFGPGDKFDSEGAPFIAALIKRFYDHRHDQTPLVVWGDGSPLREVTFSHDMARAFLWCVEHYDEPEILNVGTSEEHSIKDFAFMIADELGIDRQRIVFDTTKPNGIARKSTDNSKFLARSQFHYTPFREGLRHTIEWLKTQEATVTVASER